MRTSDELRRILAWHIAAGADEAIGETPVDRYRTATQAKPAPPAVEAPATPTTLAGVIDTPTVFEVCTVGGAAAAMSLVVTFDSAKVLTSGNSSVTANCEELFGATVTLKR